MLGDPPWPLGEIPLVDRGNGLLNGRVPSLQGPGIGWCVDHALLPSGGEPGSQCLRTDELGPVKTSRSIPNSILYHGLQAAGRLLRWVVPLRPCPYSFITTRQ